ncbi:hypothetical protein CC78DRAFT_615400 [Lojkania enalia]|uniref:Uncharacterized protein n=1 Tax=Lojkania enalia TaxID=147567 RepID=A0A9P4KGP3_9PLEO|nr:hypothetical protein CC78DRAFT_615400 [Didymosphaeria enalia]
MLRDPINNINLHCVFVAFGLQYQAEHCLSSFWDLTGTCRRENEWPDGPWIVEHAGEHLATMVWKQVNFNKERNLNEQAYRYILYERALFDFLKRREVKYGLKKGYEKNKEMRKGGRRSEFAGLIRKYGHIKPESGETKVGYETEDKDEDSLFVPEKRDKNNTKLQSPRSYLGMNLSRGSTAPKTWNNYMPISAIASKDSREGEDELPETTPNIQLENMRIPNPFAKLLINATSLPAPSPFASTFPSAPTIGKPTSPFCLVVNLWDLSGAVWLTVRSVV